MALQSQESEWSCMCVLRGIDFVSFCDFSIGFWKCSDSVVFFVCYLICTLSTYLTDEIFNILKTTFVTYIIHEYNFGLL